MSESNKKLEDLILGKIELDDAIEENDMNKIREKLLKLKELYKEYTGKESEKLKEIEELLKKKNLHIKAEKETEEEIKE